ncbi:MAG: hypothetical protein ACUVWO_11505 [Thermodesulfobacteriota bacterium]
MPSQKPNPSVMGRNSVVPTGMLPKIAACRQAGQTAVDTTAPIVADHMEIHDECFIIGIESARETCLSNASSRRDKRRLPF